MSTPHRDLLNTAAVVAIKAGLTRPEFMDQAWAAYRGLQAQGYTPNDGPERPGPIPLQADMKPRTAAVLQFYAKTEAERGRPPSMAEAADALGFRSADTVYYHLRKLVARCLMKHTPGEGRNYHTRWS